MKDIAYYTLQHSLGYAQAGAKVKDSQIRGTLPEYAAVQPDGSTITYYKFKGKRIPITVWTRTYDLTTDEQLHFMWLRKHGIDNIEFDENDAPYLVTTQGGHNE